MAGEDEVEGVIHGGWGLWQTLGRFGGVVRRKSGNFLNPPNSQQLHVYLYDAVIPECDDLLPQSSLRGYVGLDDGRRGGCSGRCLGRCDCRGVSRLNHILAVTRSASWYSNIYHSVTYPDGRKVFIHCSNPKPHAATALVIGHNLGSGRVVGGRGKKDLLGAALDPLDRDPLVACRKQTLYHIYKFLHF